MHKDYISKHTHTHTHRGFTQTHSSDEKENMSGMKASREERHENMAASPMFGSKIKCFFAPPARKAV